MGRDSVSMVSIVDEDVAVGLGGLVTNKVVPGFDSLSAPKDVSTDKVSFNPFEWALVANGGN